MGSANTFVDSRRAVEKRLEPVLQRFDGLVRVASDVEELLWLVVLVVLTADIWLTYVGLKNGLTEANPVMHLVIHGNGFAMLGLTKVLVLGAGGLVRTTMSDHGSVVPLGLAIPWAGAVLVNIVMLAPLL